MEEEEDSSLIRRLQAEEEGEDVESLKVSTYY